VFPYISLAGVKISTYALMAGIGALCAIPLYANMLKNKLLLNKYSKGMIIAIIGLICGSKYFGVLSTLLKNYLHEGYFDIVKAYRKSGIVYYGGLFGLILFYYLFCLLKRISFQDIADELAVCIPIFHFWGRIGCFLTGCCYGKIYDGFLSFRYYNGHDIAKRVPTQLLEAAFEMCLFFFLYHLYIKGKKAKRLLLIYLGMYAIFRFLIEFLRGDSVRGVYGKISFSQLVSMIIILLLVCKRIEGKKKCQVGRKSGM